MSLRAGGKLLIGTPLAGAKRGRQAIAQPGRAWPEAGSPLRHVARFIKFRNAARPSADAR
jgi:hypothetical protein